MDWKSDIFCQLKEYKRTWDAYDGIIEHYSSLLESNTLLQTQNTKLEKDVNHLRLTNAGLERASEASQELSSVHSKLNTANEEVVKHLREKGELAGEVLRLNRALTEANEKFNNEEMKVQQFKKENDQLMHQIEKADCEIAELVKINEVLREEFLAVQNRFDQLQVEYSGIKPHCLELERKLEEERRLAEQRELELMESKKTQLEMLNAEVERFNKRLQERNGSDTPQTRRHSNNSSTSIDSVSISSDEQLNRDRRHTSPTAPVGGGKIFSSIARMFGAGAQVTTNDKLNRTSAVCVSTCIPTREVHQWDCTELEVYSLLFQPSGSLLATGCSDKLIHLWEISSTGQSYRYSSLYGSHGAINALDFDNEGARLLAGCSGNKAYIWSYADYQTLKDTHTGHNGDIYTCKFVSGKKLATGCADRLIKIWDLQGRQCIRTLFAGSKCHDLVVTDAAGTIASGHFDKKVRIWDPFSDKCRTELQYSAVVTSLAYSAEKNLLLVCLRDDTIKLVDLRQTQTVHSLTHNDFVVSTDTTKAILSPDGQYACAGAHDGSLFVWNTTNGVCERVLNKRHKTMVTSLAWHPEGRYVASCEKQRKVILWSD